MQWYKCTELLFMIKIIPNNGTHKQIVLLMLIKVFALAVLNALASVSLLFLCFPFYPCVPLCTHMECSWTERQVLMSVMKLMAY